MPLAQESAALIAMMEEMQAPPLESLGPDEAREMAAGLVELAGEGRPVGAVEELTVPALDGTQLAARLYRPTPEAVSPLIVYYHGGGWVIGDLETVDATCRELCSESGMNVLSIDYRLAPEHKFPVPVDDAWAALLFAASNESRLGGDGRIVVAGDSAGGNLAAAVALRARDENGPRIDHQLLIYPVTDYSYDTDSYRAASDGILTADTMRYFWEHYLRSSEDGAHPYASPLRAPDLSGLPAATVVTAEYDPLHDEGVAYARRLQEAGVDVELTEYDGTLHGFCTLIGALPTGKTALEAMAKRMTDTLAKPATA